MSFDLFSGGGGGATILRRQLFTTVGTEDWIRPASMLGDTVWVTAIAGGGRSGTDVGGKGGAFIQRLPVTIVSSVVSVPVTVGQRAQEDNYSGRPSSFGAYVSVSGEKGSPGHDQTFSGDGPPGPFGSGKLSDLRSGGGGLLLDNTGTIYGRGNSGLTSSQTGGEHGAVLVEWMEAI